MLRLAILISGRGSNMIKLANAIKTDQLKATIQTVISNRPCDGIDYAYKLGIRANDEIIAVNGNKVKNWEDVTCEKFIDGTMINIFYEYFFLRINSISLKIRHKISFL